MSDITTRFVIETGPAIQGLNSVRSSLAGIEQGLSEVQQSGRDVFGAAVRNAEQYADAVQDGNKELKNQDKLIEELRSTVLVLDKALANAFNPADIEKYSKALVQARGALEKVETAGKKGGSGISAGLNLASRALAPLAAGIAAISLGDQIKQSVELAAKYETLRTSFTTFLGSAAKADEVLGQLNQFSTATPFTPDQVNEAGKALLAFGFTSEQLVPTLKQIGDVSAATGKDFNELALIYGKARTAGTLYAEDINQLTEAGIPIIAEFAKQLGVSEGQVKKLASEGKIGFAELEKAFRNMTSEGGRFFGLTEAQSKTLSGRISTLQGDFDNLRRAIGEKLAPAVGGLVNFFSKLFKGVGDLIGANKTASQSVAELQAQFNIEIETLKRGNLNQENRNKLIDQINAKYKDYLPNLISEKDTTDQLTEAQRKANEQFAQRITLLAAQEKLQETQRKLLDAKAQEIELEIKLTEAQNKRAKSNEATGITGQNIYEGTVKGAQAAVDANKQAQEDLRKEFETTVEAARRAGVDVQAALAGPETKPGGGGGGGGVGDQSKKIQDLQKSYQGLIGTLKGELFDTEQQEFSNREKIIASREEEIKKVRQLAVQIAELETKLRALGVEPEFNASAAIDKLIEQIDLETARQLDNERFLKIEPIKIKVGPVLSVAELEASIDNSKDIENVLRTQQKRVNEASAKIAEENKDSFNIFRDIFGVDPDSDQADALRDAADQAIEIIQSVADARVEAADRAVEAAQREVDGAQKALDTEIALAQIGYANNVELRQKELEDKKQAEAKALEEKRKAQKAQIALDTTLQAFNLITSATNIFKTMSSLGPYGVPLAIALIAVMFAAFAKTKIDAAKAAKLGDGGTGRVSSDGVILGNAHSDGGVPLEVEGGEFFATNGERFGVVNKRMTSKHFKLLTAINNDDRRAMAQGLAALVGARDGVVQRVESNAQVINVQGLTESDMREIRRNNEMMGRILKHMEAGQITDAGTHLIIRQGNTTKRIRKNG